MERQLILGLVILLSVVASAGNGMGKRSARERAEKLKREWGGETQIGEITYSGSGCPQASVATVMSPDRKTVSLLFDSFVLEKGPNKNVQNGKGPISGLFSGLGMSVCQLRIPLNVPRGVQARVSDVDVRGFMNLPEKSRAGITGHARLSHSRGKKRDMTTRYQYNGPTEDLFVLQTKYPSERDLDWTPCGESDVMMVSTQLVVFNSNEQETAMITVDSADVVAEDTSLHVAIEWKACDDRKGGRARP